MQENTVQFFQLDFDKLKNNIISNTAYVSLY